MENIEIESQLVEGEDSCLMLASNIKEMLKTVRPPLSSECCIYRVHNTLRKLNEAAYTPKLVSIGPFHYGKVEFETMEKYKIVCLQKILGRDGVSRSLEEFLIYIKQEEQRVHDCYAESIELSSDEFVKMILLDASFIIELLSGFFVELVDKPWMLCCILYDLRLLENQLPFFVLKGLHDRFFPSNIYNDRPSFFSLVRRRFCFNNQEISPNIYNDRPSFFSLVRRRFCFNNQEISPGFNNQAISPGFNNQEILPGFNNQAISPGFNNQEISPGFNNQAISPGFNNQDISPGFNNQEISPGRVQGIEHFTDFIRTAMLPSSPRLEPKTGKSGKLSYSAVELHQAGVKFKVSSSKCLFDIKFSNGVLHIPNLVFVDETESSLRNLMALEQCHYHRETYICDYVILMDALINSSKDVELLVQNVIISNHLGLNDAVATIINNLGKEIVHDDDESYFCRLCQDLTEYYENPWHRWKATLKQDYFCTPWRIVSIAAAFVLLVLTFIQTVKSFGKH